VADENVLASHRNDNFKGLCVLHKVAQQKAVVMMMRFRTVLAFAGVLGEKMHTSHAGDEYTVQYLLCSTCCAVFVLLSVI